MLKMFAQFFAMLTYAFSAGERLAKTADNLAAVGEEKSEHFLRQQRLEMKREYEKQLASGAVLIEDQSTAKA
jgi:hypothetical protein